MKKNTKKNVLRASFICLLIVAIAVGILAIPRGQNAGYAAPYIQLMNNAPAINLKDYLDSSVMFGLSDKISDDEEISVIITVDVPNIMDAYEASDKTMSFKDFALESQVAKNLEKRIRDEKAKVLSVLDKKGVNYTLGNEYSRLISGFEVVIKAGQFDTIRKSLVKGQGVVVSEAYKPAETQTVTNKVNIYTGTGIFDTSASGYDGSGMVVAVLDTGLDSAHTAFSVNNFTSKELGLTYDDVAAALGDTVANKLHGGLTVDDVYINNKVPFGYDYADNDPDVYSTHNNHGTHVSGVIVGKDDVITGAAPNAQLVSMKIFSDIMDTARSSWILSALEDCVVLGVDVINMSLGTACGFARESDEEVLNGVYDKLREAGISVIAAASNSYNSAYGSEKNGNLPLTSNPDTGTVGSPSTYKGVMSVASISGEETPYLLYGDKIMYFVEANSGSAEELDFVENLLGDQETLTIDFVVVPGVGRTADYTGLDVAGKVALVRRGDNTFEEKAMIAEAQGAAGIIIYNNVSGDIKMNVGEAKLAVCSISQTDGEHLAATGGGKLVLSTSQTSGPFISDFSSWGPTPSLGIKPEITAHGGNILSSVTGGGYGRLSGTSMACPNLAGVVVLMRQYIVENFPEIKDDNVKINAMVNKLLMSTADIALNTNGQPYAVRKQGAGLANLFAALDTLAYITTYDADGKPMDTSKLELGDDPKKTGVYEMSFTVENFGSSALSYNIGAYVMTEGVSDTKTNAGETTVTEEAYILNGASIAISNVTGGTLSGTNLTVNGNSSADVTVTITLSDEDKAYLDASFENGMYVEGYITLTATAGTEVNLSVPYLAFYGDWTKAPLFDLEYYETHADELDNSIAFEDKNLPDAYASRPIGGVSDDFVSYLGSYYFLQNPEDMVISANKNYIALSNKEGTIHSLRFVWAGLLRNAERIEITVTNDVTGEVIFETVDTDVRKSYGDGGSIYPANVEIEFDTIDRNLPNNTEYTVRLVGYMDYGNGGLETNERNVFEFPLTIDFQAPAITDVEYYYEYDKTLGMNRLYAKVGIYDNHYSMSTQVGYVTEEEMDGVITPVMKSFEQFMTPVYSQRNSVTYVTYELTDYINEIKKNAKNSNSFVITTYDYALNYASYEIGLPDNFVDFYFDGLEEGLTLSPNEVFSLDPLVYPESEWQELLDIRSSSSGVVRVVNNKLLAVAPGTANIKVSDPKSGKSLTFKVKVLSEDDEGYRRFDKPVADVFRLEGFNTIKAYYMLNSEDKLIGDTGDTRFFDGKFNLSMYPSESVSLNYELDAFFPNETKVEFQSSNDKIVTIDEKGVVTAVAEGFASVTVRVMQDGKSTYYSETVSVEVKDPFVTNGGASLSHYYGNGGVVVVPADLHLTEIGSFAFSNFEYILKTPEELEFDDAETSKQWFLGDNTITKVVIPEGVKKINQYAFASLTALEEIVLPSTLESIEYGAFYGCNKLQKVTFSGENKLQIINQHAFEGCDIRGNLDLTGACIISDYAFAGNKNMEGITTSDSLLSIGQYAFAGCKGLKDVTITSSKVKYGAYAFTDCEGLTSFYVNASVLPEGMFYECKSLKNVTVGPDVNDIAPFAFRDTAVENIEIKDGNKTFKVQNANYVLSADGKTLIAVAPSCTGAFSAESMNGADVTVVGKGAFSHNRKITSVNLPNVTVVGEYGFGSSDRLASVTLGELTQIGPYGFFETAITQLPKITTSTEIGNYAFSHTALTNVVIPDGMVIGEGVFSECLKLETVVIGNDVTIGKYAFSTDKDSAFKVVQMEENGKKYFYYEFSAALKSLTIGNNAVIGENAFACAASLESVTLGENAQISKMAFYNNCSLKEIDLSKVTSIGDYAFSGDEYYICLDDAMSIAAVSKDGYYMSKTYGPKLTSVDLSSCTELGEYAFALCTELESVVLGDGITEIKQYAFASCDKLKSINLGKVVTIGDYAFQEAIALESIDLSSAETVGKYAFVDSNVLSSVILNPNGTDLAEGVFAYCEALKTVTNMNAAKNLGNYAFAYTALTEADLSGAETLGDYVFMKEELTPFKVTLGESIISLGDNPFAMCKLDPFCKVDVYNFNGVDYSKNIYTYDLSETVKVIDGSLYCKIATGLELITFAGNEIEEAQIAEDTVRITGFAFAGSDVKLVKVPYTVAAVGHKAFYGCKDLKIVAFTSYEAPILEEEFDSTYYECLENIPGSGDYGSYTDYDGTEVKIEPMGLLPYYMWNASGGMYSNVYYGANFVDYVGYVDNKLTMIRPVNGQHYETFVMNQYFDTYIDGAAGADKVTLAAIAAIDAIPERVDYSDKHLVEAARAAYNKIATIEQQALVTNYSKLVSAEQRIIALTPTEEEAEPSPVETKPANKWMAWIVIGLSIVIIAAAVLSERKELLEKIKNIGKKKAPAKVEQNPSEVTENTEEAGSEE